MPSLRPLKAGNLRIAWINLNFLKFYLSQMFKLQTWLRWSFTYNANDDDDDDDGDDDNDDGDDYDDDQDWL